MSGRIMLPRRQELTLDSSWLTVSFTKLKTTRSESTVAASIFNLSTIQTKIMRLKKNFQPHYFCHCGITTVIVVILFFTTSAGKYGIAGASEIQSINRNIPIISIILFWFNNKIKTASIWIFRDYNICHRYWRIIST